MDLQNVATATQTNVQRAAKIHIHKSGALWQNGRPRNAWSGLRSYAQNAFSAMLFLFLKSLRATVLLIILRQ